MNDKPENQDEAVERNVRDALAEDIGGCDWTAQLVPCGRRMTGRVRAKSSFVLCGQRWFERCHATLDPGAVFTWSAKDGDPVQAGQDVVVVQADAHALLGAERASLNFLQTLSATATVTRTFVDAIAGLSPNPKGCKVLDTRKTLPGLRQAQKYAVRVGGGANHRMGLWDGILIKENHIAAVGGIGQALERARALRAGVPIQIEVESLAELQAALDAGATSVLLDDFTLDQMRSAYELTAGKAELEVSGGVTLESIRDIARTGVDRISIGALTKDIRAVDLSFRLNSFLR